MAKDSPIEWTHHTFNPWWGCLRISQGCKHCYADTWAKRFGDDLWSAELIEGLIAAKLRRITLHDANRTVDLVRVGKVKAGRILDGQTWDQFPVAV